MEEKNAEREARIKTVQDRLIALTTDGLIQRVPD